MIILFHHLLHFFEVHPSKTMNTVMIITSIPASAMTSILAKVLIKKGNMLQWWSATIFPSLITVLVLLEIII